MPADVGNLCWSPDGKSLQYVRTKDGAANVWEQTLSGAKARPLTKFTSGEIFNFNCSADHARLLIT